ncbi:MAG: DUF2961 domain-containing protein [bacterium]|nr:DUF2961 domain-containing protein [bacterium]
MLNVEGPGCITHIYWAFIDMPRLDLRRAVLRMYWDGEPSPSVEVPLGDFFGAANGLIPVYQSALMVINPGMGNSFGFNCYFPMPFARGARVTLTNDADVPLAQVGFWFHIEYEQYDTPPPTETGRFHAQWRRECLTRALVHEKTEGRPFAGRNLTGKDNYVILEARGRGQVVGLVLSVDNVAGGWWGEGDDMIFVDDEPFPPRYHGTGSEEIFGGGACPNRPYFGHYTGFSLVQNRDFSRNTIAYRWYVNDPIRFSRSVRMTIEHGHANDRANDYSSVAYWYQIEPHQPFPAFPSLAARLPLPSEEADRIDAAIARLARAQHDPAAPLIGAERGRIQAAVMAAKEAAYTGRWKEALGLLEGVRPLTEKNRPAASDN